MADDKQTTRGLTPEDDAARNAAPADGREAETQFHQARRLEAIGRLAAGIAHEINTPTQYIGDNLRFLKEPFAALLDLLAKYRELAALAKDRRLAPELLAEIEAAEHALDLDYLAQEIPQAIGQSQEGVARVTAIVRAMKEFSHPGYAEKTDFDINRGIRSTVTVSRNEWKYVADLETDLDDSLTAVPCLPNEFNQVILNLIINAAQAIAEKIERRGGGKGRIVVSTRCDGEWAEIRVADDGPGIPKALQDKVFEPFFTTKEVGQGTGQGLAIARAVIVKKHGGRIALSSEEGKGATFIIRLPLGD